MVMIDPEYVKVTIIVEDSKEQRTLQFDMVRKPAVQVDYDPVTLQQDYTFTFEAFGNKEGIVCTDEKKEKNND